MNNKKIVIVKFDKIKFTTMVMCTIMALLTIYDIVMVDKIMPITNVLWTRWECAVSVVTAWSLFAVTWPQVVVLLFKDAYIEEIK